MADPTISTTQGPVSGYYDYEDGLCSSEGPEAPSPPAPAVHTDPGVSPSAVAALVSSQGASEARAGENCGVQVLEAATACGLAVTAGIAAAPTIVGVAASLFAGARCGIDATEAYLCVTEGK